MSRPEHRLADRAAGAALAWMTPIAVATGAVAGVIGIALLIYGSLAASWPAVAAGAAAVAVGVYVPHRLLDYMALSGLQGATKDAVDALRFSGKATN